MVVMLRRQNLQQRTHIDSAAAKATAARALGYRSGDEEACAILLLAEQEGDLQADPAPQEEAEAVGRLGVQQILGAEIEVCGGG